MKGFLMDDNSHWSDTWNAVLRLLEQDPSVPGSSYERWIQTLQLMDAQESDGNLFVRLGARNQFTADYIGTRYSQALRSAFERITGKHSHLELIPLEVSESILPENTQPENQHGLLNSVPQGPVLAFARGRCSSMRDLNFTIR